MKKIIYIIIFIVLVIVAVLIWRRIAIAPTPASAPAAGAVNPAATESAQAIQNDANNVSVGNVDSQFQSIDQGINSL